MTHERTANSAKTSTPSMPAAPVAAKEKVEWTCPMHPQIVRDAPGNCPICGMALEPRIATADEEENPELSGMRRRFWVCTVLSVPLVAIAMREFLPSMSHAGSTWIVWLEVVLGAS